MTIIIAFNKLSKKVNIFKSWPITLNVKDLKVKKKYILTNLTYYHLKIRNIYLG